MPRRKGSNRRVKPVDKHLPVKVIDSWSNTVEKIKVVPVLQFERPSKRRREAEDGDGGL